MHPYLMQTLSRDRISGWQREAEQPGPHGFDATLLAWRRATTAATLSFLDELTRETARARAR